MCVSCKRRRVVVVSDVHLLLIVVLAEERLDVVLECKLGVVDDHYGHQDAEECLMTQRHLL